MEYRYIKLTEFEVQHSSVWVSLRVSYPEGAVGHIDVPPGDDDGVFDGFSGNVNTEEGAVSIISDLDVDGETLSVLKHKHRVQLSPINI